MKFQNLAIIAVIIILPLTIVLEYYTKLRIKTVDYQNLYDSKLLNATYDSICAMTLNYDANPSSDIVQSRVLDVEAAINSFYYSLANQFADQGLDKNDLRQFTPAVLYTSYDGYYIYSSYNNNIFIDKKYQANDVSDTNIIDETKSNLVEDDVDNSNDYTIEVNGTSYNIVKGINDTDYANSLYRDGDTLYGVKPYSYYIQRYSKGDYDVYVNYTLDTYITIQIVKNNSGTYHMAHQSGYLLSNLEGSGDNYTYNGYQIKNGEGEIEYKAFYPYSNEEIASQFSSADLTGTKYEGLESVPSGSGYSDPLDPNTKEVSWNFNDNLTNVNAKIGYFKNYSAIKLNGQMKYWTGEVVNNTNTGNNLFSIISFTKNNKSVEQNGNNALINNYSSRYGQRNDSNGDPEIITNNRSAIDFCKEAMKFREFLNSNGISDPDQCYYSTSEINIAEVLKTIKISDASVKDNLENDQNVTGDREFEYSNKNLTLYELFGLGATPTTPVEDINSNFNLHKREVIKRIIENDLKQAIINYNGAQLSVKGSDNSVSYQMPRISDEDWEIIANNVSMTTFLQGFTVGDKIYNNYCTIRNIYTKEYIAPNSIKLVTSKSNNSSGYYHDFFEEEVWATTGGLDITNAIGIHILDETSQVFETMFEWNKIDSGGNAGKVEENISINFYPRDELKCYKRTIVSKSTANIDWNNCETYDQLFSCSTNTNTKKAMIGSIYYTALFREKQGIYRVYNPLLSSDFKTNSYFVSE